MTLKGIEDTAQFSKIPNYIMEPVYQDFAKNCCKPNYDHKRNLDSFY